MLTKILSGKLSPATLLRSGSWVAADNWSQQILQFVCFLYVGNIIGPSAIGMMTIALTYVLFANALLLNAFTDVLIQREHVSDSHYDAVFWVSAALGGATTLISLPLAPLVAASLGEPGIAPLIQALSPVCLAMGLISFFEAKIKRELRFSSLAGRSIASVGTAFVVAVILAQRGFGVWSLVAYQLVWRAVELVFVAAVARWRPRGRPPRGALRELLEYSLHNVGIRLVDFLAQNIGRLLVGYALGMEALGLYQLARRFVEAPLNALAGVFQGLTLPLFSRLQSDKPALGDAVGLTVQCAAIFILPAFTGLFLTAPLVIAVFLKPEWQSAAPLVQVFCAMGIALSLSYFFGTGLLALGRARLTFRVSAGLLTLRLLVLLVLAPLGVKGFALGEAFVAIAGLAVWLALLARDLPLKASALPSRLSPPLCATAVMAVSVMSMSGAVKSWLPDPALLAALIGAGALSFAATLALMSLKDLGQIARFLRLRGAQGR